MANRAIQVKNISKTFRLPQEKTNSLKEHFWNIFKPKKYKKFDALKEITFSIEEGEWLGIIGRNGSGKSTLLKIITGIYKPDKGDIIINGRIVPFLELGVGFNLELSARENIFLNGTILGMTRVEIESKFNDIVKFAEIEYFLDVSLKNFSSGMLVRLAFAIAIQTNANIYILDEVLAVGDSIFQEKCKKVFAKFKQENKTVVLVSHDLASIKHFCRKAILINNGVIEAYGRTEGIIAKYNLLNQNEKI